MAQPLGYRHADGVAHAAVAVAVGDLTAIGAIAVPVVGKALESVALPRREPAHAGAVTDRVDARGARGTGVVARAHDVLASFAAPGLVIAARGLPIERDQIVVVFLVATGQVRAGMSATAQRTRHHEVVGTVTATA